MTEAGLGRLEVDAFEYEPGGVGPAEVVVLGPLNAGLLSCRVPDSMEPVRVVEVFAILGGEDEGAAVSGGESTHLEMICEEFHEDRCYGQGSSGGLGLGWSDDRASSGASGDLFGDSDGRPVEVDPADAETGALAPTKPEHRPR